MRDVRAVVLALALGAAVACGPKRYAYAPVTTTGADIVGHPAAGYPFPPDAPRGDVRLATFGLAKLADDSPRSVHVRMIVANGSTEPWIIDRSEQRLQLEVAGRAMQLLPRAESTTPARIEVAAGEDASIDLFFPLPPEADTAGELPAFEASWTVHIGDRAVTTRTPFERRRAASSAPAPAGPTAPPLNRGGERLPGTPDTRWPQPESLPRPETTPAPSRPLP